MSYATTKSAPNPDNSVIENCAFTGGIVLTDNNCVVDATFGGIVGLLAPNLLTNTMSEADE